MSSHYIIGKSPNTTYQLVPDDRAAWHAGQSAWRGYDSVQVQDHSLGIELANLNDGKDPYPPAQLAALKTLCLAKIAMYQIAPTMIVRHLDIAPGRKTDPAGLPWESFLASLFPPAPVAYRVVGVPVFESSSHTGKLWGYLVEGEHVIVDDESNLHLQDGRGFLKSLDGLEPLA